MLDPPLSGPCTQTTLVDGCPGDLAIHGLEASSGVLRKQGSDVRRPQIHRRGWRIGACRD